MSKQKSRVSLVPIIWAVLAGMLPSGVYARVGVVLYEPNTSLQNVTSRAGHAAIYFSNICAASPTKARLCEPGEFGSVLQRYPGISEEKYDWLIVPASIAYSGLTRPGNEPLIATKGLREQLRQSTYEKFFNTAIANVAPKKATPKGSWSTMVAANQIRNLYVFSIASSTSDDQNLISAINSDSNQSHFNVLWRNCAQKVAEFLNVVTLPMKKVHGGIGSLGLVAPLDLAKALSDIGHKSPTLEFAVEKISQVPGTFARSSRHLYPLQNLYRNPVLAGLTYFHTVGFLAGGAALFHEVLHRFDYKDQYHNFAEGPMASLQQKFRQVRSDLLQAQKDEVDANAKGDNKLAEDSRRRANDEIAKLMSQREVMAKAKMSLWGSPEELNWYRLNFEDRMRALQQDETLLPNKGRKLLSGFSDAGSAHGPILDFFEKNGQFSTLEDGAAAQVELTFEEEAISRKARLDLNTIESGDPALATLITIAVLDYVLERESPDHVSMEQLHRLWKIFVKLTGPIDLGKFKNVELEDLLLQAQDATSTSQPSVKDILADQSCRDYSLELINKTFSSHFGPEHIAITNADGFSEGRAGIIHRGAYNFHIVAKNIDPNTAHQIHPGRFANWKLLLKAGLGPSLHIPGKFDHINTFHKTLNEDGTYNLDFFAHIDSADANVPVFGTLWHLFRDVIAVNARNPCPGKPK